MMRLVLSCPHCGAQIDSLEEEHVVRCSFCSSKLLASVQGGSPAYSISPKLTEPGRVSTMLAERLRKESMDPSGLTQVMLTHLPFWRLQAVSYRWIFGTKNMGKPDPSELLPPAQERVRELVVRPLDHTIAASRLKLVELPSLGVRAQVLPLNPLTPGEVKEESFLPVETSRQEALEALKRLAQAYPQPHGLNPEMVSESLVGARLTLIFLPVWKGVVHTREDEYHFFLDGVDGRFLGKSKASSVGPPSPEPKTRNLQLGKLKLLPFRCPTCGWDLPFRPQSLLHLCPSCLRLWEGHEGSWRQVAYEVASPPQGQARDKMLWVPFWCMNCSFSDGKKSVQSASELRGMALQSRWASRPTPSQEPAQLYVPAMRLPDPKVSMNLAVKITGAQPSMQLCEFPQGLKVDSAGASLAARDALQMALPVLAGLLPFRNRKLLEWLAGVKPQMGEPKVRFLPFVRKDIFWVQVHTNVSFPHNPRCADLMVEKR